MTLPSFLIIGAMKAGTTTLYEDLLGIEGIWLPPQKEPDDLAHAEVETPAGLDVYRRKYAGCPAGALSGDASTAYAKLPTYPGVPRRALQVLGPDIKIIYMTRDPVKRIVSQYHHLWGLGIESRPMNRALLEDAQYVAYSRYSWQLAPWVEVFGRSNVMVVRFEDYLADRPAELARIAAFLGREAGGFRPDETHRNKSDGKRAARQGSLMQRFGRSRFYLFGIKPLIPTGLRDKVKALVLPKTRKMEEKLSEETRAALEARLAEDPLAAAYL
ncbi:MAG: sulfotransferase domain-containing protein [Alteromonadaceae bacterium]|nr:sulfotransferase domain-containing protein [Alteromonadaceae bacterium]